MKITSAIAAASIFVVACTAVPTNTFAIEYPNIMIVGEDDDKDTIRRDSRIFKRVLNEISYVLNDEGFDVFDETAVTLGKYVQGRVNRNDAEIIRIAKNQTKPPIDVIVVMKIFANLRRYDSHTQIIARVEGRLLRVQSGQVIGGFEASGPSNWTTSHPDCNRQCLLEEVGKKSRDLAREVSSILSRKLQDEVSSTETSGQSSSLTNNYELVFENFTPDDIADIERYLTIFSGYRDHRISYSSNRLHELWYSSDIKDAKLNRNLRKMLDHLDIRGTVSFTGNEFKLIKVPVRKRRKIDKSKW